MPNQDLLDEVLAALAAQHELDDFERAHARGRRREPIDGSADAFISELFDRYWTSWPKEALVALVRAFVENAPSETWDSIRDVAREFRDDAPCIRASIKEGRNVSREELESRNAPGA